MKTTNVKEQITDPARLDQLQRIVRANLCGDEIILRAYLVEKIEHGQYQEHAYNVAWQSERRLPHPDCGTHRLCTNTTQDPMLVWGHYDMDRKTALQDLEARS